MVKYMHVLSCFSPVQLFVTLWTVACQASLSMGFSRQEYGVGYHALLIKYINIYMHLCIIYNILYAYIHIYIIKTS